MFVPGYYYYYYLGIQQATQKGAAVSRVLFMTICSQAEQTDTQPSAEPSSCVTVVIMKQAIYVPRNSEARSCNDCCRGEAISIIYSEGVFVALGIQHAMRVCHIVMCGLPRSTIHFRVFA
jgi:hypothetical protein